MNKTIDNCFRCNVCNTIYKSKKVAEKCASQGIDNPVPIGLISLIKNIRNDEIEALAIVTNNLRIEPAYNQNYYFTDSEFKTLTREELVPIDIERIKFYKHKRIISFVEFIIFTDNRRKNDLILDGKRYSITPSTCDVYEPRICQTSRTIIGLEKGIRDNEELRLLTKSEFDNFINYIKKTSTDLEYKKVYDLAAHWVSWGLNDAEKEKSLSELLVRKYEP